MLLISDLRRFYHVTSAGRKPMGDLAVKTGAVCQRAVCVVAGEVTSLEFSISSRYLAVAGDKHVAVLHNVAGYRSTIAELEDKKKSATSAAMRERLQAQINEARSVDCALCRSPVNLFTEVAVTVTRMMMKPGRWLWSVLWHRRWGDRKDLQPEIGHTTCYKTMDSLCPCLCPSFRWYQVMLLGGRGTWVWTTCLRWLPDGAVKHKNTV